MEALGASPGQREVFQRPLETFVATWQDMPIPLCAETSPHIPHKVDDLHNTCTIQTSLSLTSSGEHSSLDQAP